MSSTRQGTRGAVESIAEPAPSGACRGRVLVVDDEINARNALAQLLRDEGYLTEVAADGERALSSIASFDPDVVLTDLRMPMLDGMDLLERGRALSKHVSFVVMTAFGSVETAVAAMQRGAENFLTKPLELATVLAVVERAQEKTRLSREIAALRGRLDERFAVTGILGDHPETRRMLKVVKQVAPSRATVLIHGESGTGKELIAGAIHQNSPRKDKPFVRLNCAALAESLLESELFGHERGSFTGAMTRREGRFKQAHGGTLFLDEISEVPLGVQVKLLRFLQERQFERVGGNETIAVDVRIVAATNRDLLERVRSGNFREDLYYRLNVVQVDVPPLRVRRSDIPLLASHFLRRFASESEREIVGFTEEGMQGLLAYAWPGNVRELENAVERAVVLSQGTHIGPELLPRPSAAIDPDTHVSALSSLPLRELERVAIMQALEAVHGSTAKAAELLGISQRKVQYRLRQWGLGGAEELDPPHCA